jgi:hypothetical protein
MLCIWLVSNPVCLQTRPSVLFYIKKSLQTGVCMPSVMLCIWLVSTPVCLQTRPSVLFYIRKSLQTGVSQLPSDDQSCCSCPIWTHRNSSTIALCSEHARVPGCRCLQYPDVCRSKIHWQQPGRGRPVLGCEEWRTRLLPGMWSCMYVEALTVMLWHCVVW